MKIVNMSMVGQKVATAHGVQTVQPDGTLEVDEAGAAALCRYAGFKPVGKAKPEPEPKHEAKASEPEAKPAKPEAKKGK